MPHDADPPIEEPRVVVYAHRDRAALIRALLAEACRATGTAVGVEAMSSAVLFRRLWDERNHPLADLVVGFGPYLAQSAAVEGLLDPFEPTERPGEPLAGTGLAARGPDGRWHALDFAPLVALGDPLAETVAALFDGAVERLAVPDPARAESGLMLFLAMLDQARQRGEAAESAWEAWARRQENGLERRDTPAETLAAVEDGAATHAAVWDGTASASRPLLPVRGVPPLPNAVGLVHDGPKAEEARGILDWLLGRAASALVEQHGGRSPWQAPVNGLADLSRTAAPLDTAWTFGQYRPARLRWAGPQA